MYPILIITRDIYQVESDLRERGGQIYIVDRVVDALNAVEALQHTRWDAQVVLSDVSKLGHRQSILVKLLEESHNKLVLLASQDNIRRGLLSRTLRVVKDPESAGTVDAFAGNQFQDDGALDLEGAIRVNPLLGELVFRFTRSNVPSKRRVMEAILERLLP